MTSTRFPYPAQFAPGRPAPAARWGGFPKYNFIGGHNDPESIPIEGLTRATANVLEREGHTLATYRLESGPLGYLPLREFIARRVGTYAGIQCTADDVLLTSGSMQGLELVFNLLVDPGDTVITEQFSYGGVLSQLKRFGARVEGIPLDEEGLRLDALEDRLKSLAAEGIKPKLIYVIPTVQNPTGAIMGETRRRALLEIARTHEIPIVEDECYSDLIWEGSRPPALHALDDSGSVIFLGSFSKSIAPALRTGYLIANWDVMSRALPCKHDGGSAALEQMVLGEFCNAHFERHVGALNERLETKFGVLTEALAEHFGTSAEFAPQRGGIFLWIKLPEAVDITKLAPRALEAGVAVNAGPEWSTDAAPARSSLRICFANPGAETIREGVGVLAEVCRELTGVPEHIANR